jgi:hypothetical protein
VESKIRLFWMSKRPLYGRLLLMAMAALLLTMALAACSSGTANTRVVPAAQPVAAAQFSPTLAVSPAGGHGGVYVQVTGEGWPSNMMVVVALSDTNGRSGTLAASDTDGNGRLATGFLYPIEGRWLAPGSYVVSAETADGSFVATTEFTVVEPGTQVIPTPATTTPLVITPTTTPAVIGWVTATPIATLDPASTPEPVATPEPTATPALTATSTPGSVVEIPASDVDTTGQGSGEQADSAAVEQDNRPPLVEAGFISGSVRESKARFTVVATATDLNGDFLEVVAVIRTPPLHADQEVVLKVKKKSEVKFKQNKVEIAGPDPQALLDQIQQHGGILVKDGQTIEVKLTNASEYKVELQEEGLLFEVQDLVLEVVAVDAAGVSTRASASPVFALGKNQNDLRNDDGNRDSERDNEWDDERNNKDKKEKKDKDKKDKKNDKDDKRGKRNR